MPMAYRCLSYARKLESQLYRALKIAFWWYSLPMAQQCHNLDKRALQSSMTINLWSMAYNSSHELYFPIKMGIYAQTPVFQVYMSSTELIFLEKYSKYFSKHFLLENGCLITKTPRHQRANSTCSFSLLIRAHKSSLMLPQVALAKLKLGLKEECGIIFPHNFPKNNKIFFEAVFLIKTAFLIQMSVLIQVHSFEIIFRSQFSN